jgi:hypothetical protein
MQCHHAKYTRPGRRICNGFTADGEGKAIIVIGSYMSGNENMSFDLGFGYGSVSVIWIDEK